MDTQPAATTKEVGAGVLTEKEMREVPEKESNGGARTDKLAGCRVLVVRRKYLGVRPTTLADRVRTFGLKKPKK